ncbi:MAG: ATP-binding cassette, subfamily bacterial CvaB/MchF/RaxB [Sphingomonadales bacterium]|jgi:ATP-binding cassette subfamily B protein RaxB|nr:ATP-binding cassette, subfamily bacterial CvaB/MchF/RaxB [Sphingomonadales bacterium]MEA3044699.1 ATP-binding cassette, subfamily bacterial CvaB/MchF/RaxB [Sphingomonadales bacterium]
MSAIEWPWSQHMRPLLQSEAAECGLAALAMIALHYGHRINLPGLRQRYPTSIKGTTLEELMAIASDLELAPRALRLEVAELDKLQKPAILHWDLNHFVVLESATPRHVTILDPARGRRRLTLAAFGRHFTGVALELTPTADFKPIEARTRTRLSDLWSRLSNFGGPFTQIVILSLLMQLTTLVAPFYIQLTVDEAIGQGDASLLTILLIGFVVVYGLSAVTRALRDWVVLTLGQSLSYQLGGNVIRHLVRLPLSYFERRHVGDLLSRIGSIQPIQALLTKGIVNILIDSALLVTTLVVMMLISPTLTGIVVALTLLYLTVTQLLYPGLRRRTEEEIMARANEETYLMETMRAIRAIKLHGHEALRENGWRNRYAEVISAGYKARIVDIKLDLAENTLFGLSFLLTVYFGALAVMDQRLTVGLLLAFLAYRSSFSSSASSLVSQFQKWRLLGVHLDRLSDIVGERKEEIRLGGPRQALMPGPGVRVEGLTFAYTPAEAPILDQVDIDIPPGSFVAIVGPSGSGKTTLMRILLGLLQPASGKVHVEGVPLGPATMASWRRRIAAVMQDDYLLSGTLAENIAFFDPFPDQQLIEHASRLARIHNEILKMPMGYHSLISDMGAALSAGQRQRLLLARALYRDPDALFLDEGTANLDPVTEAQIATMIAGLEITRVVIAHRPALVEKADIVFEVDQGAIVEIRRGRAAPGGPEITNPSLLTT